MSTFFSKTGDDGTTGLLGEERVSKFDLRIETLGTLDELTTVLGFAKTLCEDPIRREISNIQVKIYEIMAEVAATPENQEKFKKISEISVNDLENTIELYSGQIEKPKGFILPGDTTSSAALSMSRAVTRRAERRLVELDNRGSIGNRELLRYINRLSSCLFVFELYVIQHEIGATLTLSKGKST